MGTGAQNLNKGYIREQDAGFVWGQQGYVIMAGPSGDGGHAGNEHGADGCAFHPQTFDTVVYDNKAYASSRNLGSKAGETIDPTVRLGATLDRLINQIASGPDNPYRARVLSNLRAARGALSGGPQAWPSNVRLALTNVGGNSKGITQSLQQRGIVFIDLNNAKPIVQGLMPPPGNGGGNSAYAGVASAGPTPVAESFVKNSQRISGIASAIQAFQDTATQMSMMNIYWHGVDELARRYGEVESIQKNPKATVYVAIYYKIYNYKSTKTNELYEYRGMDIGGPSLAKGFLLESGMFGYTLRIDGLADPAKTKAPAVTGPAPNWQSFYTRLTGSLYTQGGNLADAVSSLSFLNGLSIVDICLVLMQLRRADSFGFDKLQQALDWHSARMAVNVIRLRAVFDAVRIMERVGTNQALEHYLSNSAGFAKLEPDQQLQIKGCLFGRRQNQQAETKPVGKWRVKVHKWVWIYTFDDKFNVSWRDPYNGETGKGKWKITEKKLITTWLPSSTVEEWDIPLQDADQKGIARMKDGIFKLTAERLFE